MNLKENWDLKINDGVWRRVAKFPKDDQRHIRTALNELKSDPFAGNVKKMQGEKQTWRRRIGAYRILYEILIKERIIYIAEIKRRTSKTY